LWSERIQTSKCDPKGYRHMRIKKDKTNGNNVKLPYYMYGLRVPDCTVLECRIVRS
jgi:hypothetical protein